ncbi:UvrB/UvrC motif-containing protein [Treponema saccharophilum]
MTVARTDAGSPYSTARRTDAPSAEYEQAAAIRDQIREIEETFGKGKN